MTARDIAIRDHGRCHRPPSPCKLHEPCHRAVEVVGSGPTKPSDKRQIFPYLCRDRMRSFLARGRQTIDSSTQRQSESVLASFVLCYEPSMRNYEKTI